MGEFLVKLLFLGDVVGRSGRDAVLKYLPALKREMALDFIVVNADNAAGGFGVNPEICRDFFKAGADVITGGDHIWDQKEIIPYLANEKKLLRPHNFPEKTPGSGTYTHTLADGRKVVFIYAKPGSPEGTVLVVSHEQITLLNADESMLKTVLMHQGKGLNKLLN